MDCNQCPIHEEFDKRISEEQKRTAKRVSVLEDTVKEISKLASSVEKMAINMQNMYDEQKEQGERLKTLENKDGDMWRSVTKQVVVCIVSAVIGFMMSKFF